MSGQVVTSVPAALLDVLDKYAPQRTDPAMLIAANAYFDLAGEEFGRRLLITQGNDGQAYCLRPDFTLPIAADYIAEGARDARTYGYCGRAFRQRTQGPAEFTQMGLELLGFDDADAALDRVFSFCADALQAVDLEAATVTFGSIAMFEKLLRQSGVPEVWWPRLRHRFGSRETFGDLLERLANPSKDDVAPLPAAAELEAQITEQMIQDGLSLTEGRTPQDISKRLIEKHELAAARVPSRSVELLQAYAEISGELSRALSDLQFLASDAGIDLTAECDALASHSEKLTARAPFLNARFDAGFAPRLHYYTGLVFEVRGNGAAPLASGGQYDRLLTSLGGTGEIAASGVAVWVERLMEEAGR